MDRLNLQIPKKLLVGIYVYLALPTILFLIGWCKWYIGIPTAIIVCLSLIFCLKEYKSVKMGFSWDFQSKIKIFSILILVLCWVALSGVGGYAWQNSDHACRNSIFEILIREKWPVVKTITSEEMSLDRGLIYYIGFWLPSALAGKLFGLRIGYAIQYIWAVIGILLFYSLICIWRKKILVWPLFVIIFFSGWDAVGTLLYSENTFHLLGIEHLERWAGYYQYSSMTTQLFWVFNQAIPAWLACALIFLAERSRNLIFTWSLIMITSTFPFAGLLPYIVYFIITAIDWSEIMNLRQFAKNFWGKFGSFQNVLGGGLVGIISLLYLLGNVSSQSIKALFGKLQMFYGLYLTCVMLFLVCLVPLSLLFIIKIKDQPLLRKRIKHIVLTTIGTLFVICSFYLLTKNGYWNTYIYKLVALGLFYLIEIGIYLICLYRNHWSDKLFWLTALWLLVNPLIIVGSSIDFCMRASIPALFLVMLWCIQDIDESKCKVVTRFIIICLIIGGITSLHEIKRTLIYSQSYYELEQESIENIFMYNNFSGKTIGFFWKWIAK